MWIKWWLIASNWISQNPGKKQNSLGRVPARKLRWRNYSQAVGRCGDHGGILRHLKTSSREKLFHLLELKDKRRKMCYWRPEHPGLGRGPPPAGAVAVEGGSHGQRCSASKGREETLLLSLPNLWFPAGLPVGWSQRAMKRRDAGHKSLLPGSQSRERRAERGWSTVVPSGDSRTQCSINVYRCDRYSEHTFLTSWDNSILLLLVF